MTFSEICTKYGVSDSTARKYMKGVAPKRYLPRLGHPTADFLKGDVAKAFKAAKK